MLSGSGSGAGSGAAVVWHSTGIDLWWLGLGATIATSGLTTPHIYLEMDSLLTCTILSCPIFLEVATTAVAKLAWRHSKTFWPREKKQETKGKSHPENLNQQIVTSKGELLMFL